MNVQITMVDIVHGKRYQMDCLVNVFHGPAIVILAILMNSIPSYLLRYEWYFPGLLVHVAMHAITGRWIFVSNKNRVDFVFPLHILPQV